MARPPRVVQILHRLAVQPTAPLHEHGVARVATAIARGYGASVRRGGYGNLVVAPPGAGGPPPGRRPPLGGAPPPPPPGGGEAPVPPGGGGRPRGKTGLSPPRR